jgi:hypothetical protein
LLLEKSGDGFEAMSGDIPVVWEYVNFILTVLTGT